MEQGKQRKLTGILLVVYLIFLVWILLFKMEVDIPHMIELLNFRSINLVPFGGSMVVNGRAAVSEIISNVVVFVPFGIYLSMLWEKRNLVKKIIIMFASSLGIEIMQFVLAIGASDITDLIGNTLGGVIGIWIFWLLSKLFKNRTIKILNIFALVSTVLMVLFLSFLTVVNW